MTGQSLPFVRVRNLQMRNSLNASFGSHNEALVRFLLARLRSRQAALEVAQEAYVRLLSLDEPGAVSYLRSFLFKTAANLAVDRLRRDDVHARATDHRCFTNLPMRERPSAWWQARRKLKTDAVGKSMPPKCRRAFILNRFYGLDSRW